jgi:DNA repair protein RecO (recombination protein O)
LLLEIFSQEHGRLGVIAKGVRSQKSPKASLLQLFQPLLMFWKGRGELSTMRNVDRYGSRHNLVGNRLASGFYINELMVKLMARNDPHPQLFSYYSETLSQLESFSNYAKVLRIFEKRLLEELGYGLNLDYEVETGKALESNKRYLYNPDEGAREVVKGTNSTLEVEGATLLALRDGDLYGAEQLREAKIILRKAIDSHLGKNKIRSRELLIARGKQR